MLPARYEDFLVTPRAGGGVCNTCFDLSCNSDYCQRCARCSESLAAVVPISYSVAHEQLHEALAGYKRFDAPTARWVRVALAGVLWRFLALHESCVALAAGALSFDLVTSVPSGEAGRDLAHPLAEILGELTGPARSRYERLLRRSAAEVRPREFSLTKYRSVRSLAGETVLLIDDTWTTGASARSAAVSLTAAGAGLVAAVVIGRHVNREWGQNDQQLQSLPAFDWSRCAVCATAARPAPEASEATCL